MGLLVPGLVIGVMLSLLTFLLCKEKSVLYGLLIHSVISYGIVKSLQQTGFAAIIGACLICYILISFLLLTFYHSIHWGLNKLIGRYVK